MIQPMMTEKEPSMTKWLEYIVKCKASDFHIGDGVCPGMRLDGDLIYLSEAPFSYEYILRLLKETLPDDRLKQFERERELDYSFGVSGIGRFRVNLFYQRSSIGAAIRALPFSPMNFEEIGFPVRVAEALVGRPSGLVLVTGPTGSGKTTTLAAMVDHINATTSCHIVTVEDPIEFLFKNKKAKVSQREVGSDTHSFNQALKHVLRQDPDVILIGEMRDLETMEIALTVAETGHLVFATLHTPDAVQSVNRIIDVFPSHQQQQVRVQLSFVLQAIISQQLLPKKGGGLCMAPEILIANPAIRNLIRESKSHQIYSSIQMGQKEGMRTLNMSLVELVKSGKVDKAEAMARSLDLAEFERIFNTKEK